jgi:hypothetical protein
MVFVDIGSKVTKGLVVAAVLFGSTAATANTACQPGTGCVLPVLDQAPPAPPPTTEAPPPVEAAPVAVAEGGGIGLFAILAGLAALGLLAFLVFDGDDDGVSP